MIYAHTVHNSVQHFSTQDGYLCLSNFGAYSEIRFSGIEFYDVLYSVTIATSEVLVLQHYTFVCIYFLFIFFDIFMYFYRTCG